MYSIIRFIAIKIVINLSGFFGNNASENRKNFGYTTSIPPNFFQFTSRKMDKILATETYSEKVDWDTQ
jgi:hypothetical protein